MSRDREAASTFDLLLKLPQQLIALGKAELANAKREIASKAKRGGIGLLAIVIALFFLFFAIACFVAAGVAALALVWPVWLSALVVGAGLVLLAAAAIFAGVALIKRGIPVPEEAIDRVEADLQHLSDVRMNSSTHMPQHTEKGNWR